MGCRVSADVYWGYDLGGMIDPDTHMSCAPSWFRDNGAHSWREQLAKTRGWTEVPFPINLFGEGYAMLSREERRARLAEIYMTREYREFQASQNEMDQLIKDCVVELGRYGHHDDPSYCVRIASSVCHVSNYGSTKLVFKLPSPNYYDQLIKFMTTLKLPVPLNGDGSFQLPSWHLSCSYG